MRVKYFEDTDTTLVEFSSNPPVETQEFNENIYLDFDSRGPRGEHYHRTRGAVC